MTSGGPKGPKSSDTAAYPAFRFNGDGGGNKILELGDDDLIEGDDEVLELVEADLIGEDDEVGVETDRWLDLGEEDLVELSDEVPEAIRGDVGSRVNRTTLAHGVIPGLSSVSGGTQSFAAFGSEGDGEVSSFKSSIRETAQFSFGSDSTEQSLLSPMAPDTVRMNFQGGYGAVSGSADTVVIEPETQQDMNGFMMVFLGTLTTLAKGHTISKSDQASPVLQKGMDMAEDFYKALAATAGEVVISQENDGVHIKLSDQRNVLSFSDLQSLLDVNVVLPIKSLKVDGIVRINGDFGLVSDRLEAKEVYVDHGVETMQTLCFPKTVKAESLVFSHYANVAAALKSIGVLQVKEMKFYRLNNDFGQNLDQVFIDLFSNGDNRIGNRELMLVSRNNALANSVKWLEESGRQFNVDSILGLLESDAIGEDKRLAFLEKIIGADKVQSFIKAATNFVWFLVHEIGVESNFNIIFEETAFEGDDLEVLKKVMNDVFDELQKVGFEGDSIAGVEGYEGLLREMAKQINFLKSWALFGGREEESEKKAKVVSDFVELESLVRRLLLFDRKVSLFLNSCRFYGQLLGDEHDALDGFKMGVSMGYDLVQVEDWYRSFADVESAREERLGAVAQTVEEKGMVDGETYEGQILRVNGYDDLMALREVEVFDGDELIFTDIDPMSSVLRSFVSNLARNPGSVLGKRARFWRKCEEGDRVGRQALVEFMSSVCKSTGYLKNLLSGALESADDVSSEKLKEIERAMSLVSGLLDGFIEKFGVSSRRLGVTIEDVVFENSKELESLTGFFQGVVLEGTTRSNRSNGDAKRLENTLGAGIMIKVKEACEFLENVRGVLEGVKGGEELSYDMSVAELPRKAFHLKNLLGGLMIDLNFEDCFLNEGGDQIPLDRLGFATQAVDLRISAVNN